MTVRELCERMDSRELSEWMAYTRYFVPIDNPWLRGGKVCELLRLPYTGDGRPMTAEEFVPKLKAPQHESQDRAAIEQLRRELGIVD